MKPQTVLGSLALARAASALNCSVDAFQSFLNSNGTTANVTFAAAHTVNSTMVLPADADAALSSDLPNLCAVEVNVTGPVAGSHYSFGLFLPEDWNGRLIAAAPGGGINWRDIGASVRYGFAAVSSDSGHSGMDGVPGWQTPESLIDWGYRGVHGCTVVAKSIIEAWYGKASSYNYFTGCSVGGRHALKQLQTYPEDYDGVLAGAPAWWTTHQQLWNLKQTTYNAPANSSHTIPTAMYDVIGAEVLRQCDPQDGLTDQVISDPLGCNFNPTTLLCGAANSTTTSCLSSAQLDTLYKIYNDWVDVNQTFIYPHVALGSEAMFASQLGDGSDSSISGQLWYMQNVMGLTNFTWTDLDYAFLQYAEQANPGNATADDFDLAPFYARGGKLIHWHGFSDATVAPGASVYYHDHVERTLAPQGIDVDEFYKLFLVPGLEHCTGTPATMNAAWYIGGPTQAGEFDVPPSGIAADAQHDPLLAIMAWVENGTAPASLVASKFSNDSNPVDVSLQRPICPYPQQARYKGSGDVAEAGSWECAGLY
ncbi:putative feruloyl esterase B-1 [Lasiodiplodia theobromae]|uniref:Carboxylic ester hydrolase n=1 Tax=Lasiodiplodia theobromae TaxID=45133 RepID=A0A5N5D031_9PEZI|nr:putative feruloyl esterase B-1 [Lasiodiplodia theobromae]